MSTYSASCDKQIFYPLERGYNSLSSDDEEDEHGRGLEYAFPSEGEESEHEPQEDHGSIIADFG